MFKARTPITITALALAAAIVPAAGASTGLPPCHTADLSARLGRIDAGAGQRYETLTLTNVSHHACHTYGYVGMQFLDGHGRPLPTHVMRDHSRQPHRVVLAPGHRATATLHWTVIPSTIDPHGQCGPAPRRVQITPPDQTTHLTIRWPGGQVCGRGRVSVSRLT
jgi:hypothetical protein